jgi:predicted RNA-binding protein with PIN domain
MLKVELRGGKRWDMRYLIDGYNLLHAMGVIRGRLGPAGLEKARGRLLGLLRGSYDKDEAAQVTVVFDAAEAPPGIEEEQIFHGIRVRYAACYPEADDMIEWLVRHEATPAKLTVVSDDRRLQQAAVRKKCIALGCQEYLKELDRVRKLRRNGGRDPKEKESGSSGQEMQHWLQEFADLENDPQWKEFADPYGFGV